MRTLWMEASPKGDDALSSQLAKAYLEAAGATDVGALGDGKPLQLILTRSSAYDGRHPELTDFQRPYLEYVFTMLGYDVSTFVVEPTTRWTPDERERMRAEAIAAASAAGTSVSSPMS